MNLQRILLLSLLSLVFVGAAALSFRQVWDESHTRFRAGLPIPKDVIPKQLLTQAEINAGGPPIAPEVRPTDPLLAGDAASPITLIEFGDFQSDLTKQQDEAIAQALARLNDASLIRRVWRDLPNATEHSRAMNAAIAARCAAKQGKFKAMHDLILKSSQTYDDTELLRFARRIALKEDSFLECVKNPGTEFPITVDLSQAKDLAITQVPTLFLNGVPYEGFTDATTLYNLLNKERQLLPSAP
jgi:protein-disulfide isomerase